MGPRLFCFSSNVVAVHGRKFLKISSLSLFRRGESIDQVVASRDSEQVIRHRAYYESKNLFQRKIKPISPVTGCKKSLVFCK